MTDHLGSWAFSLHVSQLHQDRKDWAGWVLPGGRDYFLRVASTAERNSASRSGNAGKSRQSTGLARWRLYRARRQMLL